MGQALQKGPTPQRTRFWLLRVLQRGELGCRFFRQDWEQGLEMLNTAQTRDRQASLRRFCAWDARAHGFFLRVGCGAVRRLGGVPVSLFLSFFLCK